MSFVFQDGYIGTEEIWGNYAGLHRNIAPCKKLCNISILWHTWVLRNWIEQKLQSATLVENGMSYLCCTKRNQPWQLWQIVLTGDSHPQLDGTSDGGQLLIFDGLAAGEL